MIVTDPQKLLNPPAQLYLSRAQVYLKLSQPKMALSDANKGIMFLNLVKRCVDDARVYAEKLNFKLCENQQNRSKIFIHST